MKEKELKKALDKELEKVLKETGKHIRAAREIAIKNLGCEEVNPYTRKGYRELKGCLKWGSKAGYDMVYFVKLKQ